MHTTRACSCGVLTLRSDLELSRFKARDVRTRSGESRFRSLISCISNERAQAGPLEHEITSLLCLLSPFRAAHAFTCARARARCAMYLHASPLHQDRTRYASVPRVAFSPLARSRRSTSTRSTARVTILASLTLICNSRVAIARTNGHDAAPIARYRDRRMINRGRKRMHGRVPFRVRFRTDMECAVARKEIVRAAKRCE